MRVTLVIPGLHAGGAERVLTTMANVWAARGWPVTVLTWTGASDVPFYPLHPAVRRRGLDFVAPSTNPLQGVTKNLRRLLVSRQAILQSRPDVVIAFQSRCGVLTLLAVTGLGLPVIVSERVDPRELPIGKGWAALQTWTYPRAAGVVVQTEEVRQLFAPALRPRIHVIPNPVLPPPAGVARLAPAAKGYRIVAMGRLVEQKGFDLLLAAFARIADRHPDWSLEIWGEGALRPALEQAAAVPALAGRVSLPSTTHEPFVALGAADLFVLSSRFEGFPNVLCEAMACGRPVVSFDCPSGPRAIIRDGVDGLLVPAGDVAALAAALDRLMGDPAARGRLAARAPEVVTRFGLAPVMAQWDDLIGPPARAAVLPEVAT